jgi:hypothetical protein
MLVTAAVLAVSMVGSGLLPVSMAWADPNASGACAESGGTTSQVNGITVCTPAQTIAEGFTPDQEAASYGYYVTLGGCIQNHMGHGGGGSFPTKISEGGNAPTSEWFDSTDVYGFIYPNGAKTSCADIASAALKLWGWTGSTETFLTAMDYTYQANASSGFPQYAGTNSGSIRLSNFQAAVQQQVYGGTAPKLSAAANYDMALNAFTQNGGACDATDLGPYEILNAGTQKYVNAGTVAQVDHGHSYTKTIYAKLPIVDPTTGVSTDHGYSYSYTSAAVVNGNGSDKVTLYGYQDTPKTSNCEDLVKSIQANASAYQAWVKTHTTTDTLTLNDCKTNPTDPSCTTATAPTCGSTIQGIGWILCPVFTAIGGLDDAMWNFASALLNVSPLQQTQTNPDGSTSTTTIYQAWKSFQAIANVVLVIVFLVVIFSQLTSAGVSNYGVKKTLPRLVVVAILINVSFYLCQIAVDVANIVGSSLYDLINGIVGDPAPPSWSALLTTVLTLGAAGSVVVGLVSIAPEAALMILIPGALAAVIGFLAAVLTLMFRQAVIPILAILAPVAFAAYLLPNTKPWFDRWWKLSSSMLLLYPLAAVMFAGVKLSANLINAGGQWWETLTALIVLGAPLFMLPFLARQSGSFLGKVNDGIKGLGGRLQKPVASWADSRRKLAMARSDATSPGGNQFKQARQWLVRRRRDRELKTTAFQAQGDERYNKTVIDRADALSAGMTPGGAGQATIRATASRAQAEQIKLAMDSMKLEAGFNSNDRTALARTLAQAIEQGDQTRATAATNYLVAARGVDELHQTISDAQQRGQLNPRMAAAMQSAVTSDTNGGIVKERRADLTAWGASGGTLSTVTSNPATWQRLSAEEASKLSAGALSAAEATGGVSQATAARILETPALQGTLNPEREAVFVRIARRQPGAAQTGPQAPPPTP